LESDFLGLVHGSGVVTNEGAYPRDSQRIRRIIAAAQRRFAAFVNTDECEVSDEVVERLLGAESIARCWDAPDRFLHIAESSHDVNLGLRQLRSELARAGGARGVPASARLDSYALTFVMRTFLYLAYSDAERLNLTLDSNRQPISSLLLAGEAEFRSRVLTRLRDAYRSTPGAADLQSTRRLSPFAAIVFQRARPHKHRLVYEMEYLRKELANVRIELRSMEATLFQTDVDARRATSKLNRALAEIDRRFATQGHQVSLGEATRFASDAVEIVAAPQNPVGWVKAVFGLPKDILDRWLAQRTLLSVHALRDALPASESLRSAVHELFGDLVPYGEPTR
jgi:hypothetical protein